MVIVSPSRIGWGLIHSHQRRLSCSSCIVSISMLEISRGEYRALRLMTYASLATIASSLLRLAILYRFYHPLIRGLCLPDIVGKYRVACLRKTTDSTTRRSFLFPHLYLVAKNEISTIAKHLPSIFDLIACVSALSHLSEWIFLSINKYQPVTSGVHQLDRRLHSIYFHQQILHLLLFQWPREFPVHCFRPMRSF